MQSQLINVNNISFNEQLFMMICEDEEDNTAENENKFCLITNNILEANHITLKCGHKFNYYSIFNEIKNQKTKQNSKEIQHLRSNQIKCPYCRTVQKGLLPDRINFPKIKNVNWPKSQQYMPNKCSYVFLSGKKKNMTCNKKCHNTYCSTHEKIMNKRLNKSKSKAIHESKNKLSNSDNNNNLLVCSCNYIFKKGKNKGKCCSTRHYKNGLCKTHYKIKTNKQNSNTNSIFQNTVITV
tara:strand:- start:1094 stop:1807 length:714 start_codon:yes stop_codon:yes gene_type:complete